MTLQDFFESDDLRRRFEAAGYSSLDEIRNKSIIQLTQDIELTEGEVAKVASILNEGSDILKDSISAAKLVKEQNRGITTSCRQIDQLFTSLQGIPNHGITEISGASGSGKTQFCMQLSLNVQQPTDQGGLGGECIYIDTEGGLIYERICQMTQMNKDPEAARLKLQNIHYFRVLDPLEMIAIVRQLPDIFKKYTNVKLLIIDSISYHLRLNIRNHRTRVGMLNFIGQNLIRIAGEFNISIVVTNQASPDVSSGIWRPTLGDSWSKWCTNRLFLTRQRQLRLATMYGAPQNTEHPLAPFFITQTGIEDVDEETQARLGHWRESNEETQQWQKSEWDLDEESLEMKKNHWQELDLNIEHHYHLEDDNFLPPPTKRSGNDAVESENGLTEQHIDDLAPPMNQQNDDDYILAPDSQPDHLYEDLSICYAVDAAADPTANRRRLSPTQDSITKRQRHLDDSGKDTVDNSFETLYDSQDENDCTYDYDELYMSVSMSPPLPL